MGINYILLSLQLYLSSLGEGELPSCLSLLQEGKIQGDVGTFLGFGVGEAEAEAESGLAFGSWCWLCASLLVKI